MFQKRKALQKGASSTSEADSDEEPSEEAEEGEDGDGLSASEKVRNAFLEKKKSQENMLLKTAKSLAKAGVPVLTVRSELCEGTLLAAVKCFLKKFFNYRRSLLMSPQCIPLPKARNLSFAVSSFWVFAVV